MHIPTIAGAEKLRETQEKDKNATATPKAMHAIVADECPLNLDALLPIPRNGSHPRQRDSGSVIQF